MEREDKGNKKVRGRFNQLDGNLDMVQTSLGMENRTVNLDMVQTICLGMENW